MYSQTVGKFLELPQNLNSGQTNNQSNYRPILVLSFASRVFEKSIHNQLYGYIDRNKFLFSKQSGFRSLQSAALIRVSIQQ